jgi:hypothetical protein
METLKIVNVPEHHLVTASGMAIEFIKEFPERIGSYHGVIFSRGSFSAYVYRLKSMIVVRGQ